MKSYDKRYEQKEHIELENRETWDEQSGFLDFLAAVPTEVNRFNDTFGFGISNRVIHPADIDGDAELPFKVGFVYTRDNLLMPQLVHCLYSVLRDRVLYGYIGVYKDGSITTVKELKPIKEFEKGKDVLYDWMRALVKASSDKITL